jgi:hypothetical protein
MKATMPSKFVDITGRAFGFITILGRGPNASDGTSRWWAINSLNVEPNKKYLVSRRALWRKGVGCASRHGCGYHLIYKSIYHSVKNHFKWIYDPHNPKRYHGYKGMPAYEPWNPLTGGQAALIRAVREILAEIGNKPGKDYHLHVVDKRIGFWPGNLIWIPIVEHKRAELLNQVIKENAFLKKKIVRLKSRIRRPE